MEDIFQNNKQNVGAGIDSLMSVSDGISPSTFCRKMEKARPMRQEMDGKSCLFPTRVGILTLML